MKFKQWFLENDQRVFRIDPQKIDDFSKNLKTYYFMGPESGSVEDTSKPPEWAKGQQGEFKTGLFTGGYKNILSYLIPRHIPWVIEHTTPKKTLYYNKEDQQEIEGYSPYISSFDPKGFTKLDTSGQGEYFSENPPKPIKQAQIKNPLRILASQFNLVPLRNAAELQNKFREILSQGRSADAEGLEFN